MSCDRMGSDDISEALGGDMDALARLFQANRPAIIRKFAFAWNIPHESEDLSQELFLELLRGGSFARTFRRLGKEKNAVRNWFLGCTRTVAIHWFQKQRRTISGDSIDEHYDEDGELKIQAIDPRSDTLFAIQIRDAFSKLTEQQKRVIAIFDTEGSKSEGLNSKTSQARFKYARDTLKKVWNAPIGTVAGRRRNEKLNEIQRSEIKRLAADGMTHRQLAIRFGVARPTITNFLRGYSWRSRNGESE